MTQTLTPAGGWAVFPNAGRDDWLQRRLEGGVSGGSFGGANLITGYMNFAFTRNISLQVNGSQILGEFSDGVMGTLSVMHRPFPGWRFSPYMTLGAGILHVEPHSTLVLAEDRTDEVVNAGAGASFYLTRRFVMKGEYRYNVVLTSRDDNEEIHEWTVGFSVFF
ncbi:MAG: outer membrane beta-barrel protein [Gammaproteobacteria bacterium]